MIERSLLDVQSPTSSVFTDLLWEKSLGVKFAQEALENPHQQVNSEEITTGIDSSHVADQLRNLWREIILSSCRDISGQSFVNLAVGRCASNFGGYWPTWRVISPHPARFGQDFGSKIIPHFYAFKREISSH